MTDAVPPVVLRPALARWLWERDIRLKAAGDLFGCSYETIRAICRPFEDPDRRVPAEGLMKVIVQVTGGDIRPADFYPPQLNLASASAEEAA